MEALKRISTGIRGVDSLTGGGFIEGKVHLVSGESGTGKTVFSLQFINDGLAEGEGAVFVSSDQKPRSIVQAAESFGWDFEGYIAKKKLALLEISPYFAEIRLGKVKEIDEQAMVNDLTKHVKRVGARRIVFDTLAPIVFGEERTCAVQEYVRNIVFAIEDNLDCVILATSSIPSGTLFLSRYGVAEFISSGVIVLGVRKEGHKWDRTLTVRKMIATATDLTEHHFEILPKKGIVVQNQSK